MSSSAEMVGGKVVFFAEMKVFTGSIEEDVLPIPDQEEWNLMRKPLVSKFPVDHLHIAFMHQTSIIDDSLNLIFYFMVESPNKKPMFADEQEVMDGLEAYLSPIQLKRIWYAGLRVSEVPAVYLYYASCTQQVTFYVGSDGSVPTQWVYIKPKHAGRGILKNQRSLC